MASVNPSVGDDAPSGDRWRRARELVARAAGRRESLERMRAGYQRRLHATSDDFDATDALRVVELALVSRRKVRWSVDRSESRSARAVAVVEAQKEPLNCSRNTLPVYDWLRRHAPGAIGCANPSSTRQHRPHVPQKKLTSRDSSLDDGLQMTITAPRALGQGMAEQMLGFEVRSILGYRFRARRGHRRLLSLLGGVTLRLMVVARRRGASRRRPS